MPSVHKLPHEILKQADMYNYSTHDDTFGVAIFAGALIMDAFLERPL